MPANHKPEPYYVSAVAHCKLEFLFRNQVLDAKYKPARYHILLAARMLAAADRPPQPNANAMNGYCNALAEILWDSETAESLFTTAAMIVKSVASGNFDRDHIRTQPFTEYVKEACSAVGVIDFAPGDDGRAAATRA